VLVKAQDDLSETAGHLGMTLIRLAKFEREQATSSSQRSRAGGIHNFAHSVLKFSRSHKELNSEIVKDLVGSYMLQTQVWKTVLAELFLALYVMLFVYAFSG
jgi:hypothetical protein